MINMVEQSYGILSTTIIIKVGKNTMSRLTLICNEILNSRWMWGWKRHHFKLSLQRSYTLELIKSKDLYEEKT